MRMIDANALKDEMRAGCVPIGLGGITGITGDDDSIEDYIDAAPTIPAITVDWLKEQRDKRRAAAVAHSNISSMTVLEAINVVMELWQKEQEAR